MVYPENKRIFLWKYFSKWKPALEDIFREILTPEFQDKIRQNVKLIQYSDDSILFKELSGLSIDSIITDAKIKEFRQRYSHIRVYHACRTTDAQSYYEKGILSSIALKDTQVSRFREIFLSGRFPELTEEMLQQSIAEVGPKSEDLCLALDDRWIIERAGQYLVYGSEYLSNLASQLPIENIEKYRSVLRKIGKPTFFEINLPNTSEYVSDGNIWELHSDMLTEWLYNIAHSRVESNYLDFTFSVEEPLPPEYIQSDYNFTGKIPDPLMRWKLYNAETGEYEDSEKK